MGFLIERILPDGRQSSAHVLEILVLYFDCLSYKFKHVMLILSLFSVAFYIVYCNEKRLKKITPYGKKPTQIKH